MPNAPARLSWVVVRPQPGACRFTLLLFLLDDPIPVNDRVRGDALEKLEHLLPLCPVCHQGGPASRLKTGHEPEFQDPIL